ncbi:MAG: hypothetical protein UU13_C0002G0041 [Candidatus Nomurabacteria bacterium GW2011_GWB1_40_7]|uniref:General secretion pathway protein G n=1 Tax=Candidatus Nomurabacteria bacterium GW2011_GWB1_40_7 TaxID=1618744 RepID=A0A0G0T7H4_9BACT|nr:MAG: hypothetical protein UU13_C0002G0041 [Candidatus Nomurabacteria bacterium GW2011_GWB1_40_7]
MKNIKIFKKGLANKSTTEGFTLIELLVVVAIIGILIAIVSVLLTDIRAKGDDAAVKTNLQTIKNQAELFYLDNGNSYLPAEASGEEFYGVCPVDDSSAGSMFSKDKVMFDAVAEATKRGNGSYCYASTNGWAVAVGLKTDAGASWCVDSEGASTQVDSVPSLAIDESTFACSQINSVPLPNPPNPLRPPAKPAKPAKPVEQ